MKHDRNRTMRVGALMASLLVAACSGGGEGAGPTTTTPTTVSVPPVTTPTTAAPPPTTSSTTATTQATIRPTLATTGEDWETIAREIVGYRIWLGENPQPDRLADIYLPECECYQRVHQALVNLQKAGERFDDEGSEVVNVEYMDNLGPNAVRLIVIEKSNGPARVINAQGRAVVQGDGPTPPPKAERYFMKRGTDGRWRVSDIFLLGKATPEQLEGT